MQRAGSPIIRRVLTSPQRHVLISCTGLRSKSSVSKRRAPGRCPSVDLYELASRRAHVQRPYECPGRGNRGGLGHPPTPSRRTRFRQGSCPMWPVATATVTAIVEISWDRAGPGERTRPISVIATRAPTMGGRRVSDRQPDVVLQARRANPLPGQSGRDTPTEARGKGVAASDRFPAQPLARSKGTCMSVGQSPSSLAG